MNGSYCPGQGYALTSSDKIAVSFLYPKRELPMELEHRIAFAGGYAVPESNVGGLQRMGSPRDSAAGRNHR